MAGQALTVGQAPAQLACHPVQGTLKPVDLVGAPGRCRHRTSGVRGHPRQGESVPDAVARHD